MATALEQPNTISIKETAKYLNRSENTIRNWLNADPPLLKHKKIGGSYIISRKYIMSLVEE